MFNYCSIADICLKTSCDAAQLLISFVGLLSYFLCLLREFIVMSDEILGVVSTWYDVENVKLEA